MTLTIDIKPKNALTAKRALGMTLSVFAVLGILATSAVAADRRGGDHRGGRRDDRGHAGFTGGYYPEPPVVYGAPYYYGAPPVIYGPSLGITLGIR